MKKAVQQNKQKACSCMWQPTIVRCDLPVSDIYHMFTSSGQCCRALHRCWTPFWDM